jgi:CRISPR-associated protein Csx1
METPTPIKLLIAPVGNPTQYKRVTYRWNGKEPVDPVQSKISVILAMKGIQPDKTLLFLADSAGIGKGVEGYSQLRERALKNLESLFETEEEKKIFQKISVKILPGKGKFAYKERGNNLGYLRKALKDTEPLWETEEEKRIFQQILMKLPAEEGEEKRGALLFRFSRSVEDYSALSFYYIVETLLQLLEEKGIENPVELHLDMTHGINFMTPILQRNLLIIGGILSYFTKVTLFTYNSDPLIPTHIIPAEEQKLNFNRISKEELLPAVPKGRIRERKLGRGGRNYSLSSPEALHLNGVLGGYYFALPLVVAHSVGREMDLEKIRGKLKKVEEEYWNRVKWKEWRDLDNRTIEIGNGDFLLEDFKKGVMGFLLGKLVRLKIPEVGQWGGEEGVPVEVLQKIATPPPFLFAETQLRKDLHGIEEKIAKEGEEVLKNWVPLGAVLRKGKFSEKLNRRNFLAHGGFGWGLTEVRSFEGKLHYRYTSSSFQKIVQNFANPEQE